VKTEAFLAFAGLTWNDVQRVDLPSYTAAGKGLIEGRIDAINYGVTAPILYELETSPQGIFWPEFPASDVEGWKRLQAITPWLRPGKCDMGPGFKKGQFKEIPSYTYPQLVCYAKQDPSDVYSLVKAFDETFDMYKAADSEMPAWDISKSGKTPAGAPFHEGAIRYLKEKGIWTAEADEWNTKFLGRLKKVKQAWKQALEEANSKKISEKDFPEFWMKKRNEIKDWVRPLRTGGGGASLRSFLFPLLQKFYCRPITRTRGHEGSQSWEADSKRSGNIGALSSSRFPF
jgi:hypothetical protein